MLPKQPFQHLALSMSGGGYRAASFHLGSMSYLSTIDWQGNDLLQRVRAVSTVSGGTFTGVSYLLAKANGAGIRETYAQLYRFMSETDLIKEALGLLADRKDWHPTKTRSLINAFARVYDQRFVGETFDRLWEADIHVREMMFNATEFSYGLPFRFQRSEAVRRRNKKGELYGDPEHGYVGNQQVNIPVETARECKMADIVAASSCFPAGFEPINFPQDFRHKYSPKLDTIKKSKGKDRWEEHCEFPLGLMDGGIVDNQGIDSIYWAERRMNNYEGALTQYRSDDRRAVDLYIISDVSSPFMDNYLYSEVKPEKGWRKWSFGKLRAWGFLSLLLGMGGTAGAFFLPGNWKILTGAGSGLYLILGMALILIGGAFNNALRTFDVPQFFLDRIRPVGKLRFGIYEAMIKNRINSVGTMVADVFMKQVRRLSYGKVYDDEAWDDRLITNTVYELEPKEVKRRLRTSSHRLSEHLLRPGDKIQAVASLAKSMGTTLWFTDKELGNTGPTKANKLNALIACGQFTMCFNLLDYIEKVLWKKENAEQYAAYSEEMKGHIQALYDRLLADWNKFKADPYWMVEEWK